MLRDGGRPRENVRRPVSVLGGILAPLATRRKFRYGDLRLPSTAACRGLDHAVQTSLRCVLGAAWGMFDIAFPRRRRLAAPPPSPKGD